MPKRAMLTARAGGRRDFLLLAEWPDPIESMIALGGAAITVAFVFGAPIDEARIVALDGLLFAATGLRAGGDIGRPPPRPPPVD